MKNDLRILLVVTCLLVLALSSCQNSAQDNSQEQPAAPLQQIELTQPQEVALGNSQVAFSIQLLQQACQAAPQDNVCLSPIGIANQLSLIANGTQGETQSQMLRALQVDSIAQSNAYHSLFMSRISQDTTVSMANMVVLQPTFKVLPAFNQIAQEQYRSTVRVLSGNTAKDVAHINRWCAKHTKGMIPDVADEDMLLQSAMVLLNAVSFDAEWVHKFESWDETYTFHTPTQNVKADELSDSFNARYCQPTDKAGKTLPFKTLCLDYAGEKYEMMIVLPRKGIAADSLLPLLTPDLLWRCSEVEKRLVYLQMPKVDMSDEVPVKNLLQSMGVTNAFDRSGSVSNFSLLSPTPTYISDIMQKVVLKIDEDGTKAAAVTITEVCIRSGIDEDTPEPIEFIVNRPYLLFLREKSHGTILFAARINDPTARQ